MSEDVGELASQLVEVHAKLIAARRAGDEAERELNAAEDARVPKGKVAEHRQKRKELQAKSDALNTDRWMLSGIHTELIAKIRATLNDSRAMAVIDLGGGKAVVIGPTGYSWDVPLIAIGKPAGEVQP